jgi:hypothetical protein
MNVQILLYLLGQI